MVMHSETDRCTHAHTGIQCTTNLFTCRCRKHQIVVDGVRLDSIHQVQDRHTRGNARVLEAADAGGLTCIAQLRRKEEGGRERWRVKEEEGKVGGRDGREQARVVDMEGGGKEERGREGGRM